MYNMLFIKTSILRWSDGLPSKPNHGIMASAHPLSIPPAPWNSTVNLRKTEDLSRQRKGGV